MLAIVNHSYMAQLIAFWLSVLPIFGLAALIVASVTPRLRFRRDSVARQRAQRTLILNKQVTLK